VYQTPRRLSDLDAEAAAETILLRAVTSAPEAASQYRLYVIGPDHPSADPAEQGRFLIVRVGEGGAVHEVAAPSVLPYQEWAENLFDRLWDGLEEGILPGDGEAEQALVDAVINGPAPESTVPVGRPAPQPAGADIVWTPTPDHTEELVPGVRVLYPSSDPEHAPDPDDPFETVDLIEAVVRGVPDPVSGDILVQDVDEDDEPYLIPLDRVVQHHVPTQPVSVPPQRFRPTGQQDLAPSGRMARVRANIAAIRVLHDLRDESRPATPEEQALLARWSSWGAVPGIFDPRQRDFAALRGQLRSLLTEEEWHAAEATTRNAHFTDVSLVEPVWKALADLGFTGGRVLEPGSGSGNFIAFAPDSAQMTGVELDPVTAEISRALYPDAEIRNESFVATRYPEGYFDASIGNVPFDEIAMTDPLHNPLRLATHNHFIVKALELTRPGGLVAVLTSRYTLDSTGRTARLEIADRADLVGAVRLPAGAHWKAAGTKAVTDLLILRRRDGEPPATPPDWVGLSQVAVDEETRILVNSHFGRHPEMVLGTHAITSSQFSDKDITVRPTDGVDLGDALTQALAEITRKAREDGLTMSASPAAEQRAAVERRVERMRFAEEMFGEELDRFEGTVIDQHDGTFLQIAGGELTERAVFRNAGDELTSLLRLRDTYVSLLSAESTSGTEDGATALRAQLNQHYDAHTTKYGFLNVRQSRRDPRTAHGTFRTDPYAAGVYALEVFDQDTGTAKKSPIFTKAVTHPQQEQTADTPQDALAISLNRYREVRLGEIAELLGLESLDEARDALGDLVFNEPGSQKLVLAAEYLSGDLGEKLDRVEAILRMVSPESRAQHPFQRNAEALRQTMPPPKTPGDIEDIQIGATWVAPRYYEAFIRQLLQTQYVDVKCASGADWEVSAPRGVRKSRAATVVYGTAKRDAAELLQRMLRRNSLVVHPGKPDENASPEDIANGKRVAAEQTEQAVAKAEELNRLFGDWLWQDHERATDVLNTYNRRFNSYVPYQGDGKHLTFPGLSDQVTPRPHQRAGVARALHEGGRSFFDYEVGFGKTFTISLTLMEMKRLGMVKKPCIVVKNPTVGDFRNDFLKCYPHARVLAIDSADFTKDTAAGYIAQIANGDWDAVILPQSLFKRIPVSGRGQQQFVADQTAEYRARIHKILTGSDEALAPELNPGGDPLIAESLYTAVGDRTDLRLASSGTKETIKRLQGDLKRHTQRAEKNLVKSTMGGISWEQTGIDGIVVDEVQDFANAEIGANNSELALTVSAQSRDLMVKLRNPSNRVAIGSTGTPFPNAMAQAYVMLNYFRPDLLERAGLSAFSSFQAQYLTETMAPEISPEGIPRIKERIGAFRNAMNFHQLWKSMADVQTKYDIQLPIPEKHTETAVVPATAQDKEFMAEIADRAEEVRAGDVDPSVDNLLKISNDGRLAALDLRMVGWRTDGQGKIDAAAERIAAIYHEYKDRTYTDRDGAPNPLTGALQLVFSDRGTPSDKAIKEGRFIAYHYLRDELVARGVPEDKIRFAQDANTAQEKAQLFSDARLGKIAILIGSTDTMGVGVNVQDRAIALHHLDCPWRPSDVTQREGRIVRQFNQHYLQKIPVQVYRWIKEGSFDSFMWQTVERKARFTDQVRTGRDLAEQDQALDGDLGRDYLEFGEIKAIATGNPLLLKQAAADEEVRQLEAAYTNWKRTEQHLRNVVDSADETLDAAQNFADLVGKAVERRAAHQSENQSEEFRAERPSGAVVTKRQELASALRTQLSLMHRRTGSGGRGRYEHVATISGQMIMARVNNDQDFIEFAIRGLADVPQATFFVDDVNALVSPGKAQLGLISRMENHVAKLDGLHTTLQSVVAELRQEIERAQKLVGKPFSKMDRLLRARAEQAQIKSDIQAQADGRTRTEDEAEDTPAPAPRSTDGAPAAQASTSTDPAVPATAGQISRPGSPPTTPYADRSESWAAEEAVVTAYREWAGRLGAHLDRGSPEERGLAQAAELMLTESTSGRQSRLLGFDHFTGLPVVDELARHARAVAEQWDRQQRNPQAVTDTRRLSTGIRDHASRYRSTVEDPGSAEYQRWASTDEPVTVDDQAAEEAAALLDPVGQYTITGPGGLSALPTAGAELAAGVAQLIADGAAVEQTATGLILALGGGMRFDVVDASALDHEELEPEIGADAEVQARVSGPDSDAPRSSLPNIEWAAAVLGRYLDPAELVAGRELVATTGRHVEDLLRQQPVTFESGVLEELSGALAATRESAQLSPEEVFAVYDRLALAASGVVDGSEGAPAAAAEKLQLRTERHLARMQAHGNYLFDELMDASSIDPESLAVLARNDPAKERPTGYSDITHLNLSRTILFEAYDRWPLVSGGGGEADATLRGAMWERREMADTRIGAVLPEWMQVVAHAMAAADAAEGQNRTILRDVAQRAFQHHQSLSAHQLGADQTAPYEDAASFMHGTENMVTAWENWLATGTARELGEGDGSRPQDAPFTGARTAQQDIKEALHAVELASTTDGTLDDLTRQTTKLAHATYALALNLRLETFRERGDQQVLDRLVRTAYEHAAACRAASLQPAVAEQVRQGVTQRQTALGHTPDAPAAVPGAIAPATSNATLLEIEHDYRNTIVRGTTNLPTDAEVRRALDRHGFKYKGKHSHWVLPRSGALASMFTRNEHVRRLVQDLQKLGRSYQMIENTVQETPVDVRIPVGEPYTSRAEAEDDFRAADAAYWSLKETPAGQRMIGSDGRPDGRAVHAALASLRQGPVGSNLDPFAHPGDAVAERCIELARTTQTLSQRLAEEKYRAPAALPYLRTMTQYATLLASRISATAEQGLWEPLFSTPAHSAQATTAPDADVATPDPSPEADANFLTQSEAAMEPNSTGMPPASLTAAMAAVDPLVAGPYTREGLWEAIERLGSLRNGVVQSRPVATLEAVDADAVGVYNGRWSAANQAGYAAHRRELSYADAAEAYQRALGATNALIRELERGYLPPDVRALVSRLVTATEHHLTRLSVTHHIAEEAAAAEQARREQEREAQQVGSTEDQADEELAAARQAKRAEVEASIAVSLAATHMRARQWAVRAALSADIVRQWFQEGTQEEMRPRFREWLRALSIPDPESAASDRFSDWFVASGPEAEEIVAEEVFGDVYASLAVLANAPSTEETIAVATPAVVNDAGMAAETGPRASAVEYAIPAKATEIAQVARANGWHVDGDFDFGDGRPAYLLTLRAVTAQGERHFILKWSWNRGRLAYSSQESRAIHNQGKSAKKGFRPKLSVVEHDVALAAVPAGASPAAPEDGAQRESGLSSAGDRTGAEGAAPLGDAPTAPDAGLAVPGAAASAEVTDPATADNGTALTAAHLDALPAHSSRWHGDNVVLAVLATIVLPDARIEDALLLAQSVELDPEFGDDPIVRGAQVVPPNAVLSTSVEGRWKPRELLTMPGARVLPLAAPIPWSRVEELVSLDYQEALRALPLAVAPDGAAPALVRRFAGTGQLKTHFKAAPMPHLDKWPGERDHLRELADNRAFQLTPNGQFALYRNGDATWALRAAGSGLQAGQVDQYAYLFDSGLDVSVEVMSGLKSREEAVVFSQRLAGIRDHLGEAITWDDPQLPRELGPFGPELDRLVLAERAAFDRGLGHQETSTACLVWELMEVRPDRRTAPDGRVFADEVVRGGSIWFHVDDEDRPRRVLSVRTDGPAGLMTVEFADIAVDAADGSIMADDATAQAWDLPRNYLLSQATDEQIRAFWADAELDADIVDEEPQPTRHDAPAIREGAGQAATTEEPGAALEAATETRSLEEGLGLLPVEKYLGDTGRGAGDFDIQVPGSRYVVRAPDGTRPRYTIWLMPDPAQPTETEVLAAVETIDLVMPRIRRYARNAAAIAAYEELEQRAGRSDEEQPAVTAEAQHSTVPAPFDDSQEQEENVTVTAPEAEAGSWSSRIKIVTEGGATFVTGTGGSFFQQEAELRDLLKKDRAFAFRDGRWRYQGRLANRERVVGEVRAYLAVKDTQQAAADAAAAAITEYPPTPQQQAIIDAVLAGQDVAVQALAGTGKTSTLLMLTRRMPERRIAYIAFNRSIADEAKRKFPRRVTADTSHAYARVALRNTPLGKKVNKAGKNGGAKVPKDVAPALGLTRPLRFQGGGIEPQQAAQIVMATVRRYRESADAELGPQHLGEHWAESPATARLLELARQVWADKADPDSNKFIFDADDYIKLWALSEPRLPFDLIMFDEAQDINPVLQKVIRDQAAQKVVVGDSHQAIYEFRGAIDALKDWPADVHLPLTQSWRFGPDVAAVGNAYLNVLGADLTLEGNPGLDTILGDVEDPDAVLTKTNMGAIGAVFAGFDAGKRVALVGGGREIEDIAKAARELQNGRRTKHPELSAYADWGEVRQYADSDEDAKSLQTLVRLVDKFSPGGLLQMIKNLVPEDATDEETRPELVVSTAHKAKGREWGRVRIGSDFAQPKEDEVTGEVVMPPPGDLRLAYVTVTRAKEALELGSLSWIQMYDANLLPPVEVRPTPDVAAELAPAQEPSSPAPLPEPAIEPATAVAPTAAADLGEPVEQVASDTSVSQNASAESSVDAAQGQREVWEEGGRTFIRDSEGNWAAAAPALVPGDGDFEQVLNLLADAWMAGTSFEFINDNEPQSATAFAAAWTAVKNEEWPRGWAQRVTSEQLGLLAAAAAVTAEVARYYAPPTLMPEQHRRELNALLSAIEEHHAAIRDDEHRSPVQVPASDTVVDAPAPTPVDADSLPLADPVPEATEPGGLEGTPQRVLPPSVSVTLSQGPHGGLFVTVIVEERFGWAREVPSIAAADVPDLALAPNVQVPMMMRAPGQSETLVSSKEVEDWLNLHLPSSPLAAAWSAIPERAGLVDVVGEALRDSMSPNVDDVTDWLVEEAGRHHGLLATAHADPTGEGAFAEVFREIADELVMDGGGEHLIWTYLRGGNRFGILQAATSRAYEALRQQENPGGEPLRAQGTRFPEVALEDVPFPLQAEDEEPISEPSPEAGAEEAAASGQETAVDSDEELAATAARVAPLPWDKTKINKRGVAGLRRAAKSALPDLGHDVMKALGRQPEVLSIWRQDNPWAQYESNLRHVAASFGPKDAASHQLVEQVAAGLQQQIEQIADRAANHYNMLIAPHSGNPVMLDALERQLTADNRLPELSNAWVREALILVMETIDGAEAAARRDKLKAPAVRDALDQVVGLSGVTKTAGGESFPRVDAALTSVLVQLDNARELMADVGLNPTTLDTYRRVRELIAAHELQPEVAAAPAAEAVEGVEVIAELSAAADETAVEPGQLTNTDISVALGKISAWEFAQLIFDSDQSKKRYPEGHAAGFTMPAVPGSVDPQGWARLSFRSNGLEMEVTEPDGTVRQGKLTWNKVLTWLRPALAPQRKALLVEAWRAGNMLVRSEDAFRVIGEHARFLAVKQEVFDLRGSLKEATINESLRAHLTGQAESLIARNRLATHEADDSLISLDEIVEPAVARERAAAGAVLERLALIQSALPERHTEMKPLSEVRPGDGFWNVSPQRLLFVAGGPAVVQDDVISIAGELILASGQKRPYTFSQASWTTLEQSLQYLLLPKTLDGLVDVPADAPAVATVQQEQSTARELAPDEPTATQTATPDSGPVQEEETEDTAAAVETVEPAAPVAVLEQATALTTDPAPPVETSSTVAEVSAEPAPLRPQAPAQVDTAVRLGPAADNGGTAASRADPDRLAPYADLASFTADFEELRRAYAVWGASATVRHLVERARDLEAAGARNDSLEAARIETAWLDLASVALGGDVDPRAASRPFLMFTAVAALAGRSLDSHDAFASRDDRRSLQSAIRLATRQSDRLEATEQVTRLLAGQIDPSVGHRAPAPSDAGRTAAAPVAETDTRPVPQVEAGQRRTSPTGPVGEGQTADTEQAAAGGPYTERAHFGTDFDALTRSYEAWSSSETATRLDGPVGEMAAGSAGAGGQDAARIRAAWLELDQAVQDLDSMPASLAEHLRHLAEVSIEAGRSLTAGSRFASPADRHMLLTLLGQTREIVGRIEALSGVQATREPTEGVSGVEEAVTDAQPQTPEAAPTATQSVAEGKDALAASPPEAKPDRSTKLAQAAWRTGVRRTAEAEFGATADEARAFGEWYISVDHQSLKDMPRAELAALYAQWRSVVRSDKAPAAATPQEQEGPTDLGPQEQQEPEEYEDSALFARHDPGTEAEPWVDVIGEGIVGDVRARDQQEAPLQQAERAAAEADAPAAVDVPVASAPREEESGATAASDRGSPLQGIPQQPGFPEEEVTESLAPGSVEQDDVDQHFNGIVEILKQSAVSAAPMASTPTGPSFNEQDERRLRDQYTALRRNLNGILGSVGAEPIQIQGDDRSADAVDAAALDAAVGAAQDEAGAYWGTPEWETIRQVHQAGQALRSAVREAVLTHMESMVRDVRVFGLDRTIQVWTARAVSQGAFSLARRLDRDGARDTGAWRAVWRLHRAATTRADRLTGLLPAGQRIDLSDQLRGAWQWLAARVTTRAAADGGREPNGVQALIASGFETIKRYYHLAERRIGDLAQHPLWRRVRSAFESSQEVLDDAWIGVRRLGAERATLGTGRMLWVRTVEVIAHSIRTLLERLERGGDRDGLRWNVLRALHHAAEENISHLRGFLPEDVNSPLGTYYDPQPDTEQAQETTTEAAAEATPVVSVEAELVRADLNAFRREVLERKKQFIEQIVNGRDQQAQPESPDSTAVPAAGSAAEDWDQLREAVDMAVGTNFASAMLIRQRLSIGAARTAVLLQRMEDLGIVGPKEGTRLRPVLADREEAARILDRAQAAAQAGPRWTSDNESLRNAWFTEVRAAVMDTEPGGELTRQDLMAMLAHESVRVRQGKTDRVEAGERANHAVELYLDGRGDDVPGMVGGEGQRYVRREQDLGWQIQAATAEMSPVATTEPATTETTTAETAVEGAQAVPQSDAPAPVLPQRRGPSAESAPAHAVQGTPDSPQQQQPAAVDQPSATKELLTAQADRLRDKAGFAAQAASTTAEQQQAQTLLGLAEKTQEVAQNLTTATEPVAAPDRSALMAEPFLAALHVHAAARGVALPDDVVQSAWEAATKATAQPRRTAPEPTGPGAGAAAAPGKKGPQRAERRESQQGQALSQQRNARSGPRR
jgi:N12 class adenine-specific DNA methylase